MCGRYAANFTADDLVDQMQIELDRTADATRSVLVKPQDPPAGRPDWNMAPTKQAPVVLARPDRSASSEQGAGTQQAVRQLRLLTWGLVPSWAKDTKVGIRMINARAETLLDKNAFAKAAVARRCLVPAAGWYEWQVSPTATTQAGKPRKQPFFVRRADEDLLAFAGVYEFWRDRSVADTDPSAWVASFSIITTRAEDGLERIHDRQPSVLDRGGWDEWLDPTQQDPDFVRAALADHEPGRFEAWPVGAAVSSGRNNGAHLLDPAPASELGGVVDPTTGEVLPHEASPVPPRSSDE